MNQTMAEPIMLGSTYQDADCFSVDNQEIAQKEGNFIFTVGNVSCGKSTLQNVLIYRLWGDPNIAFDYANRDGNHVHDAILNQWVQNLSAGQLPDRTRQGILQEFNIRFGMRGSVPLSLNFLEISGEDIKSILPSLKSHIAPRINGQLERYLHQKKVNKRFLFISDASQHMAGSVDRKGHLSEDILFNELLKYLLSASGANLRKLDILFVVSKWDLVKGQYTSIEEYFKRNFPQTLAVTRSDRIKATFLPFSVGVLELVTDDNGARAERIVSLERAYIDRVIQWVYSSFTGSSLKALPRIAPTRWQRIKQMFV